MRKNVPDEPNISEILSLLFSLDGGLLKAVHAQGVPIILVTAVPVAWLREDDENDYDDEADYDAKDAPEDGECCCPEFEPANDGSGRCVYACPECGACLREYIGEEFE